MAPPTYSFPFSRACLAALILWLYTEVEAGRYALLVGRNDGGREVESLRFAEDDARKFSSLLENLAGFQSENIVTLLSPDPQQLEQEFRKLSDKVKSKGSENSLFLFYYSGHSTNKNINLGEVSYSLEKLQKQFETFPSQIRVAVFDACHSGTLTRLKGGTPGAPFYLESQKNISGQVIIAASAAEEKAQESDELRSSIFSHHWFNGLRGSADLSGDKKVTLREAYEYAYSKTLESSALAGATLQHPSYQFKLQGQGEIILTHLDKARGGILIDKNANGRFLILTQDFTGVTADLYKPKGRESFLAVDPGRYVAVNRVGRASGTHYFSIEKNSTYVLRADSLVFNPLDFAGIKGANPYVLEKSKAVSEGPLDPHAFGIKAGILFSPFEKKSNALKQVNLGILYAHYINRSADFFGEFDWAPITKATGGAIGVDLIAPFKKVRPFAGFGTGMHFVPRDGSAFEEIFGLSLTARAGISFDLSDRLRVSFRVPYRVVFNKSRDQTVGLDFALHFSNPLGKIQRIRE